MPVLPPIPPPPVGTSGVGATGLASLLQALGEVVVEQVPDRLASLARTVVLSGLITETRDGGAVVVRTQVGDLVVRSSVPLPRERVLTLQIPPGAPPVRAQVAVALPPGVIPEAGGRAELVVPTQGSGSPPVVSQPVVYQPAVSPGAPPSMPMPRVKVAGPVVLPLSVPLLPGTLVSAQVLDMPVPTLQPASLLTPSSQPPVSAPAPVAVVPTLARAVEAMRVPAPPAALEALIPAGLANLVAHLPKEVLTLRSLPDPALSPSLTPPPAFRNLPVVLALPAGSLATVQVVRIQVTSGEAVVAPVLPPGFAPPVEEGVVVFPAVVVGQTPKAGTILTSPAGLLVVDTPDPLPTGTRLEVSLVAVQDPPPVPVEETVPLQPRDWPVLQQIAAQLPPDMVPPLVRTSHPPALGSQVLFLLAALGFKDSRAVVGEEASRWLTETGKGALLTQLSAEMQQMGQGWSRGTEGGAPVPTEWRSLSLPVPPDGAILRLAVHMRQMDPDDTGADPEGRLPGRHLVVEVDMSRLGPLVLDGFIRARRFDLTLRSQRRLPPALRDELHSAFLNALEGMDWRGSLAFQTAADLWLGHSAVS